MLLVILAQILVVLLHSVGFLFGLLPITVESADQLLTVSLLLLLLLPLLTRVAT